MVRSLKISGYRGFSEFTLPDLGRVNLLVGTNNSGKTSVLEALYLLTSRGDPAALWQILWRRGERLLPDPGQRTNRVRVEIDVCHLFIGHEVHPQSKFTLESKNNRQKRTLAFEVTELTVKEQHTLFGADDDTIPSRLAIQVSGTPSPAVEVIPLSRAGGMVSDFMDSPRRIRRSLRESTRTQFITTESLDGDELIELWNRIALTPDENLVLKALRFLDKDIERIAAIPIVQPYYPLSSPGGFIVKRTGLDYPIPIGSMGDGMRRLLALTIALTQCKGGVLLIDEIDTGLHYSVMAEMWRHVFTTARELDVQVFATTHSFDCVNSLASICNDDNHVTGEITLQRIEAGRTRAVAYNENEIKTAADRVIEVR